MKFIKQISIIFIATLLIYGCGQTNYLQWAKANESPGSIDQARTYIDNAEYAKAESVLNDYLQDHPSDSEANILYGQCQMGLAGIDLASIVSAMGETNPTPSISKLNKVCSISQRSRIYSAAEQFNNYPPKKASDKIISAICGMSAFSSKMTETFDTNADGVFTSADFAGATVITSNWVAMNGKHSTYLNLSIRDLTSLSGDQDLVAAATSMNKVVLETLEIAATSPTPAIQAAFTWSIVYGQLNSF